MIGGADVEKVHFGITNFELVDPGMQAIPDRLDIGVKDKYLEIKISIKPLADYEKVMRRLRILKGVDVTCEMLIESASQNIKQLKSFVDNLCWILSVARGTSIQWIYIYLYDDRGNCTSRSFFPRKTKPYCPLYIIAPIIKDTKLFLEKVYPSYIERRDSYRLNEGIIASYIDAKIETDYLEARGVKLVVAMEMLKDMFLELPDTPIKYRIIEDNDFKELLEDLQKAIGNVLKSNGRISKSERGDIYKNILGLNHRSFPQVLEKLCEKLDFEPKKEDIDLFITCRNSLVHRGRYYCQTATPEEKAKRNPKSTAFEEYMFLVNFLDRIFLKMLNYGENHYIDWSKLPPTRRILT